MLRAQTDSEQATCSLAAALEPLLGAGDLLVLSGDLGAGKTTFVRGLAAALGVSARVTSPTFTLAHTYQGRLRLHHLDAYRLERGAEVLDLDLPALLDDQAVVAIEWGDRLIAALPKGFLQIRIGLGGPGEHAGVRVFEFVPSGSWQARAGALESALTSRRQQA
jgi:tRNA threonylcarbamoyladenosine biosynthesis protein TsaE